MKKVESSHKTKDKLIIAAEALFSSRGFHAASIRDIAVKAKTNVASAHYYFKDKYGLYEAVLVRHFDEVKTAVEQAKFYTLTPKEQMLSMCKIMQNKHIKGSNLPRLIHHVLISEQDDRLKSLTKKIMEEHIKPLCDHLQHASKKCRWKKGSAKMPDASFTFLILAINSYWTLFAKDFHNLFSKSAKQLQNEAFLAINLIIESFAEEI